MYFKICNLLRENEFFTGENMILSTRKGIGIFTIRKSIIFSKTRNIFFNKYFLEFLNINLVLKLDFLIRF